ncbi:hypothetical protein CDCA_CDCA05G1664 [Cyanidium caldarium]|uniref:Uncharacterized protein n=1 Tax=Cyanidium caldarium TaxID=2771 RepID=A0AAV9IU13_CYACA|nr:hypothetical protein CDCA_CDCA05G1664 [Cyanidium caldarium]
MFSSTEENDAVHFGEALEALRPLEPIVQSEDDRLVAVVTGCSTGIGLQLAAMLAGSGLFRTLATLRRLGGEEEQRLRDLAAQYARLAEKRGGRGGTADSLQVVQVDVTDESSVWRLREALPQQRIDVLVNNAGFGVSGNVEQVTVAEAQRLFDTNFFGVMRTVHALAPLLRAQARRQRDRDLHCAILQICSTAGVRAVPFSDLYSASKFALAGLTESMRYYLHPFGVRCVCVDPGPVRTAFVGRFGNQARDRGSRTIEDDQPQYDGEMERLHSAFVRYLHERMGSAEDGQSSAQVAAAVVRALVQGVSAPNDQPPPLHYGTSPRVDAALQALRVDPAGWSSPPYRSFWEAVQHARQAELEAQRTGGVVDRV